MRASSRGVLVDGAGVAPAPLWYAHGRSGSPWVPVRPYYEGLPLMAGRGPDEGPAKAGLDQRGVTLPRSDPEVRSRGGRRHSGAPGGGVPARHVGAFYEVPDYEVAPIGAPLPHVGEGKGNEGAPRADQTAGATNHACRDALF